jgi:photosystem II stability/assembly factor-like uncharacterized protein
VEDLSLRASIHRALDPAATPAPWLSTAVRDGLRSRWASRTTRRQGRAIRVQAEWLIAAVAVLLAVAIVSGLVGTRVFRRAPVPVGPPIHQGPGSSACQGWGPVSTANAAQPPIKMMTPLIGWADGALRSEDGGAHWKNMTPSWFVSDAPSLPGETSVEPPGYSEFFLDSNRAWIARTYGSATVCSDRIQTFNTSDGGRTWVQVGSIPLAQSRVAIRTQLDFVDPNDGWLIEDSAANALGRSIYFTTDGGTDWNLISGNAGVCDSVAFTSANNGWSSCTDGNNSALGDAELLVSRDGGRSWTTQYLPSPPGGCSCSTDVPLFTDRDHGFAIVLGNANYGLLMTTDGGQTWRSAVGVPRGWFPVAAALDPAHIWLLVTSGSGKGAAPTLFRSVDGGATWSSVAAGIPVVGGDVVSLQFLDADHGFVIQSGVPGGQMLATTDGGRSWTAIDTSLQ